MAPFFKHNGFAQIANFGRLSIMITGMIIGERAVMKTDRIRNDIIRELSNNVQICWCEYYGHAMGRGE